METLGNLLTTTKREVMHIDGRRRNWWFCDSRNPMFSSAPWNGKDPILKERLFGLTNNHKTTEMLKNFIFTKFQRLIPTTNTSINILKTNFLMMIWCQKTIAVVKKLNSNY
jgi:hypothetical protein